MDGEDGSRRRLTTPEVPRIMERERSSRSRSRRYDIRGEGSTARRRSRSPMREAQRSLSLRQRELEVERQRKRLRDLEGDLERSRSRLRRSPSQRGSRRRDSSVGGRRRQSITSPPREPAVRGQSARREDRREVPSFSNLHEFAYPSFSTDDVINLLKTLKSQPQTQPQMVNTNTNFHLNQKNMLPEFDPSSKNQRIDIWLKKVNECATVYGWDDKTTVHFALQKLQGLAKTWYESLNTILFSWAEWQDKLLSAFPYEQNFGQTLEDMLRRKSRYNEPLEVYYYEKLALLNQCDIVGKRAVDCIIHGLSDRTMKSSALALRCTQPDQLLQFLMSNRDSSHNSDRYSQNYKSKPGSEVNSANNNFSNKLKVSSTPLSSLFCFNCKEKGHPYLKCPKPLVKCTNCHRIGHQADSCRDKTSDHKDGKNVTVNKTMCISSSGSSTKFNKDVLINGVQSKAFVDFGSEVSLMRSALVSVLGLKCNIGDTSVLKGFGNDIVYTLGSVNVDLAIDDVVASVKFLVVEDKFLDLPLLVGQSFTEQPHVEVYKNSEKLRFLSVGREMPFADCEVSNNETIKVRLASCVDIYGPASIKVVAEPTTSGAVLVNTNVIGKPLQELMICGGLYELKGNVFHVCVKPLAPSCKLIKGTTLGRAFKVKVVNRIISPLSIDAISECKNIDEQSVKIGERANQEDKKKLLDILNRYKHCFANTLKQLGCTSVTEMTIELNSKQPVVYRPYRLSHKEREQVREMVDEMLDAGIIRESVSEYASPIILVRKKDGKLRLCVDYRLLNSVTVKERYPMPIIEDEIARLSGQSFFITLDLASGYYQVPISEQSKALTSFVTPDGQYEFNRMPFGLANAPAVFQRMMNRVLGSSRYTEAMAYIDDVLIYGKDKEECLERLEKVLKSFESANLTLNLSKCEFLRDNIDYLGYEIGSAGVRPGDKKIRCVVNFPRPTNIHSVRQFLGLVGYFRKFVKNFAQIANPLNRLLRKDAEWSWEEDQENAFQELKERLVTRPILAIYDPSAETELHTDASQIGVGGILLQRAKGKDSFQPVSFYSRQTTPEEKHFHAYELETLAVVCSLRKFRIYLLGQSFKIVTDCSALRSTFSKRDVISRIARWWLLLQEFNCTIEYRPGSKMSHVDALSRNPVREDDASIDPCRTLDNCLTVMSISQEDWLQTLQLGDTELNRIRNILTSKVDVEDLKYIHDNYVLRDDRLYKYIDNDDKTKIRWVVPKGARWQLCRMNHDDIGHFGVEKTLERIKKSYWFPRMTKFIKKYVGACLECAYSKKTPTTKDGVLHTIEKIDVPFHTVHIDHLGPFVKSKRGNTHLLVIVEAFTKFIFLKPVRNTNTVNAIKALEDIFYTFRNPDRLISDRGSCFTSHAFRQFCLDKGIKHVLNAVASPRSNGQVERYNRTILSSLTAQNLNNDEKDWDTKVGRVQWGLNNTCQKTTGRSPAEVMFGTSMNAELDPRLNEVRRETCDSDDLVSIRNKVKDNIQKGQERQKLNYDKGRRPARIYSVGDLVKITRVCFKNDGKSAKLLPSYVGPYRVVSVLGNDRYRLSSIPGLTGKKSKRKTTVASDRMLPWVHVASLDVQSDDNESDSISIMEIDDD